MLKMTGKQQLFFLCILFCCIVLKIFADSTQIKVTNGLKAVKHFTGRREDLELIYKLFQSNRVIYISGLGGIGKTQLIRKYVDLHKNEYDIIWWFDYEYDLNTQLVDIAEQINKLHDYYQLNFRKINTSGDLILSEVVKFINKYNGKLLFIFENVPDIDKTTSEFTLLTELENIHLIFSSRKEKVGPASIKLTSFRRNESIAFLQQLLQEEESVINELADSLGDYPLALEQAAAFLMENPSLTIQGYKTLLTSNREKPLRYTDKKLITQYDLSLFDTLKLTFNKIKKEYPKSYKFLMDCRYLDNENIDNHILEELFKYREKEFSHIGYLESIRPLIKHSLIKVSTTTASDQIMKSSFQMHKLIQQALLDQEPNQSLGRESVSHIAQIICNMIPEPGDILDLIAYTHNNPSIIKNAIKVLNLTNEFKIYDECKLGLEVKLLRTYIYNSQYSKAEKVIKYLDLDIETNKYKFSTDKAKIYLAMYHLCKGLLLELVYGDSKAIIKELNKASKILTNIQGAASTKYFNSYLLAQTEIYSGNIIKANQHIKKAEDILIKYAPKSISKYPFYFMQAKIRMEQGKLTEALEIAAKGINQSKKDFPNDKLAAIDIIALYCEILLKLQRYDEAYKQIKQIFQEIQEYYAASFDDAGFNVKLVRTLIILASAENALGYTEDAKFHIDKAISLETNCFEDGQHDELREQSDYLADAYIVYADIMRNTDKLLEAQQFYKKAIRIYHNRFENNIQWDSLGEMYKKIINTSLELNDPYTAVQYFNLHETNFGIEHPRSKEMYLTIKQHGIKL